MSDSPKSDDPAQAATARDIIPAIEEVERELASEFKDVSPEIRHRVASKVTAISISHSSWDGAYPPPSIIKGYENIQPGLADRIFSMTEKDLDHRHQMDRTLAAYKFRGQAFGFTLALTAIIGSVFLIFYDFQIAGSLLGGSVIIPLVTLFVKGQLNLGQGAGGVRNNPETDPGQPRQLPSRKPARKRSRGAN